MRKRRRLPTDALFADHVSASLDLVHISSASFFWAAFRNLAQFQFCVLGTWALALVFRTGFSNMAVFTMEAVETSTFATTPIGFGGS